MEVSAAIADIAEILFDNVNPNAAEATNIDLRISLSFFLYTYYLCHKYNTLMDNRQIRGHLQECMIDSRSITQACSKKSSQTSCYSFIRYVMVGAKAFCQTLKRNGDENGYCGSFSTRRGLLLE